MRFYIKLLREYVLTHPFLVILSILLSATVAATQGATAWVVKPLLDKAFIAKDAHMIKLIPIILASIYIIKGTARFSQNYIMSYLSNLMVMKIRVDLYSKIQSMNYAFLKKRETGELISRILNDVNVIKNSNVSLIKNLVSQVLTLIVLFGFILRIDWLLALFSISIVPPLSVIIYKLGRTMKKVSHREQENLAQASSLLVEGISGAKIVKAFCAEDKEISRFKNKMRNLLKLNMKAALIREISGPTVEIIGAFAISLIVYIGGKRVLQGAITPGEFFSFMTALFLLYDPINKLSKVNTELNAAAAAAERIYEFLDMKTDRADDEHAMEIKGFKDSIRYINVWFRYSKEEPWVLKGINLHIKKGEKVAIVGESGAGKTTLVDLLPRFYDPEKGAILIDNIDIKNYTIKSLRNLISIVTQDIILFNDTIYNNILYGKPNATKEEVIKAAKLAFAHEFIEKLPNKYDTIIGEKGTRLSGGEKQRIAIARAILKDAPILILDEATSALDAESEKIVQEALYNLMQGKTVLIVAHRLASVVEADRIIVMKDGRVIEEGSHYELIRKKDSTYRKLCEYQGIIERNSQTVNI